MANFIGWLKRKLGGDTRVEPRVPVNGKCHVEYLGKQQKGPFLGEGRDISERGIRFATQEFVKKGDLAMITLRFPEKFSGVRKVEIPVQVRYFNLPRGARRHRVGCELLHKNESSRECLKQFIKWQIEHMGQKG